MRVSSARGGAPRAEEEALRSERKAEMAGTSRSMMSRSREAWVLAWASCAARICAGRVDRCAEIGEGKIDDRGRDEDAVEPGRGPPGLDVEASWVLL